MSSNGHLNRTQSLSLQGAALDAAANAIVITDTEGIVEWVNPAFTLLTGYSANEVMGSKTNLLKSGQQNTGFYRMLWATVKGGQTWRGEIVNRKKDGSNYTESMTITPVRNEAGEIAHFIAVKEDISQRKNSETDLATSEKRYRRLFEAARDGILILDHKTGAIQDVNPFLIELLGYSREQFIGMKIWDLGAFKDVVANEAYFEELRRNEFVRYEDTPLEASTGKLIHVEFVSNVYLVNKTKVIQCNIRDITERKKVEEMIANRNTELESRVQERTAQLRIAKEDAEKANQAKSEFLSRMSHEFRTPLNAILGFAQLLAMQQTEPKTLEKVGAILKAGQHLLRTVNEVLDISRIESGNLAVSVESVPVLGVLRKAVDLMQPIADQAGIRIQIDPSEFDNIHVIADEHHLVQVFINLLNNAVKYNRPDGEIHVTFHLQAGNRGRVIVSDRGHGISHADQEFLFQPFQRFGHQGVDGTGLGLALSQGFVKLMGGSLGLAESTDEGSAFYVELMTAEAPEARSPSGGEANIDKDSRDAADCTVLYIEDNDSNTMLLEAVFKELLNSKLITASLGRVGMELASEHVPDLILLDLHLPDISGDKVLKQLKADPITRQIPVIVLSAEANPKQIVSLRSSGAVDYLTKPIDLTALLASLEAHLPAQRTAAGNRLTG